MNFPPVDETKAMILRYFKSREWWMFFEPERMGIVTELEKRFYWGAEANADLHLIMMMHMRPYLEGLVVVWFGRKSRLSKEALEGFVQEVTPGFQDLEDRDCVVFSNDPNMGPFPEWLVEWAESP